MTFPTTYLLNVALHAAILSIFASGVLLAIRQARYCSVVAIFGLLAVGFLPWITAIRPARPVILPAPEIQTQSPNLPVWRLVTLPMAREIPRSMEPHAAPPKFVFPAPLITIVTTWAAGCGIGFLLLVGEMLRLRNWRKYLSPPDDAAWETFRFLTLEIPSRQHFLISTASTSPCVSGFFRSRIVLPQFLLSAASEEELRWAVRHEIAHWQAGDSRWVILFALIRCVNWWNPLVHYLASRWSEAREQLCDLQATGNSDSRADYGQFLVAMASKITKQPPLAVAMAKRLHARRLKQRIISLLGAKPESQRPVGKNIIALNSAAFIACAAITSSLKINAEESATTPPISQPAATVSLTPPGSSSDAPKITSQFKLSTKFLLTDFPQGFIESMPKEDGAIFSSLLSEGQFQMMMRSLSQKRGAHLFTAPNVASKLNQSDTISITRQTQGSPEQIAKRGADSEIPFVGITLTCTPRFHKEGDSSAPNDSSELAPWTGMIELEQTVDYRFVPGIYQPIADAYAKPPENLNPEKIKTIKRSIKGKIPSGYTFFCDLGEIEPGKYLTIFTRVDAMDVDGEFIDMQRLSDAARDRELAIVNKRRADEGALPLAETPGSLRLSAALVEIPLKRPRPPGEGLVIGLTPTVEKVADEIRNTPGGKVRELQPVLIPLNQAATPWAEFPGLNITAIASKNHKIIRITSHSVGSGEEEFPNTWEQLSGDVMNFGIRTTDTTVERRLLITLEAVK